MVSAGPKRIAVILLRQIGDVLLVTPALAALRRTFPSARIVAVVNDFTAPMLDGNPDLNEIIVHKRQSGSAWAGLIGGVDLAWRIRREQFDVTLDLTNGDRAAMLSWFSGAPRRLAFLPGPSKLDWRRKSYTDILPRPDRIVHQVERHMRLLVPLGVTCEPGPLVLKISEEERAWAREQLREDSREVAVVHLVANWLFKCWEDEKAAKIIDWLQTERGFNTWLTCGPARKEMERAQRILDLCKVKPTARIGTLSLRQLSAIIAESRLFVGVDTAPMHMAAALGVPLVAIFGPTDKTRWRPWCKKSLVLSGPCPCVEKRQKLCSHDGLRDCLKAVSVEEVQRGIDEVYSTVSS